MDRSLDGSKSPERRFSFCPERSYHSCTRPRASSGCRPSASSEEVIAPCVASGRQVNSRGAMPPRPGPSTLKHPWVLRQVGQSVRIAMRMRAER
eukprot:6202198-Pleurochrysis_carterae.AAC.4